MNELQANYDIIQSFLGTTVVELSAVRKELEGCEEYERILALYSLEAELALYAKFLIKMSAEYEKRMEERKQAVETSEWKRKWGIES